MKDVKDIHSFAQLSLIFFLEPMFVSSGTLILYLDNFRANRYSNHLESVVKVLRQSFLRTQLSLMSRI